MAADLLLVEGTLGEQGLLVIDDVFEPRWPDVTAAVFDWLRDSTRDLTALALVERRLYLCPAGAESELAGAIGLMASELADAGHRVWSDVQGFGGKITVAKP